MVENPRKILEEIFCFVLGVKSLDGTYIGKRIQDITGKETNTICKPREGGVQANRNIGKYSKEQIEMLKQTYRENLIYFGYIKHPTIDNKLAFFDFDDLNDNDLTNYCQF